MLQGYTNNRFKRTTNTKTKKQQTDRLRFWRNWFTNAKDWLIPTPNQSFKAEKKKELGPRGKDAQVWRAMLKLGVVWCDEGAGVNSGSAGTARCLLRSLVATGCWDTKSREQMVRFGIWVRWEAWWKARGNERTGLEGRRQIGVWFCWVLSKCVSMVGGEIFGSFEWVSKVRSGSVVMCVRVSVVKGDGEAFRERRWDGVAVKQVSFLGDRKNL